MSTQKQYVDRCAFCGRDLKGNGSKVYWPAFKIREIAPKFKGREVIDPISGIPHEEGFYVCRSAKKCGR